MKKKLIGFLLIFILTFLLFSCKKEYQHTLMYIGHSAEVNMVVFAKNNKIFASSADDKHVNIWSVNNKKMIVSLRFHTKSIKALAFSNNNKILASGGLDSALILWNTENWEILKKIEYPQGVFIFSTCFSNDDNYIAVVSSDSILKIFRVKDAKLIKTLKLGSEWLNNVSYSKNNKYIVCSNSEGVIYILENYSYKLLHKINAHSMSVTAIKINDTSKFFATGSHDKTVKIFDIKTGKLKHKLIKHKFSICDLVFYKNILVSSSLSGEILYWNLKTGILIKDLSIEGSAYLSNDGKWCASTSSSVINLYKLCFIHNC